MVPLVLRSQNKLQRLLKKGVDFQADVDFYAAWPEGLFSLLRAGYEASTDTMRYALNSGPTGVQVLRDTRNLDTESLIPTLTACMYPGAREMVIQELAERRKQLWDIAVKRLPSGTLSQLGVKPGTLLGYKAAQVYKILKTKGISAGDIECRQGWLVYEAASLDTDLADRLWDVGFRDVDDVDDQGMTALMTVDKYPRYGPYSAQRSFNMVSLLIGKGADTRLSTVIWKYTALHFVGAVFGRLSHWPRDPPEQGPSNFEIVMNLIMLDDSRDSCHCYCSPPRWMYTPRSVSQ